MSIDLPAPIAAYVAAQNGHDAGALAALFTEDGLVHDEARERRGRGEIQAWMQGAIDSYAMTTEPQHFEPSSEGGVMTSQVTGTFPGSPITLKYAFTLAGDRISRLSIAP